MSNIEPIAPTVTENWLKCPTYGYFKEHWEPCGTGRWTPNMLLGIASAKGIEVLLKHEQAFQGRPPEDNPGEGKPKGEAAIIEAIHAGYVEQDDWPVDSLITLALKGFNKTLSKDGVIASILCLEHIRGVELQIGRSYLDLVTERADGLVVTDHKVALQLDSKYLQKRLLESGANWQLFDAAWRATEYFGRPVVAIRRHQVILSPTVKSVEYETKLTPTWLEQWRKGAEHEWGYIHYLRSLVTPGLSLQLPVRLTACDGKYGRCEFYEACHVYERDPKLMRALYNEKTKREET